MTQDQKTLFEVTIEKVKNSSSSIFAKADVIGLLTTLNDSIEELPQGFSIEYILDAVKETLEQTHWDDLIDCEPELQGSYGDSYSLEMNTSFNERDFTKVFIDELEDYFTPKNK